MKRQIFIALTMCASPLLAQGPHVTFTGMEPAQASRGVARAAMAGDDSYGRAVSLLDSGKYEDALRAFDRVQSGTRMEGALYWKAYCLNKLGRKDEALAALAKLKQDYASSRWAADAKVLEAEVQQGTGKPGADNSNEELKLLAINSTLASDPERGIPILEHLLKSNNSPRLKDRALFVLTQSSSPKAQQILVDVAKGGSNPDLQMRALRYIGMSGSPEAKAQLVSIYNSSNDLDVKRTIIRSLMMSGAKDKMLELSRNEKNPELRREAIRQLGMMGGGSELKQIYASEQDAENKKAIIQALMMSGNSDQLLEVATNEKDSNLRGEAIRNLGMMHKTPISLYASGDAKTKREIISGLFMSGDAKSLVELARKEQDPEVKKRLVQQLSMMHSKEATDYMLEILK